MIRIEFDIVVSKGGMRHLFRDGEDRSSCGYKVKRTPTVDNLSNMPTCVGCKRILKKMGYNPAVEAYVNLPPKMLSMPQDEFDLLWEHLEHSSVFPDLYKRMAPFVANGDDPVTLEIPSES